MDLKFYLDLIKKHELTAYSISKNSGLPALTIQNIIDGITKAPRKNTFEKFVNGIEKTIAGSNQKNELKEEYTVEFRNQKAAETPVVYETKGVPYYDVEFAAGFEDFTQNQAINPSAYVVHPFFNGCDYVIRASGQSMAKVIKHGDLIGITKVEDWFEFLPFGEIYAIVTKSNFRMIKVITQGKTADSFTLISKPSENKKDEFPPQEIKKSKILSIFKVQASSYLF